MHIIKYYLLCYQNLIKFQYKFYFIRQCHSPSIKKVQKVQFLEENDKRVLWYIKKIIITKRGIINKIYNLKNFIL